MSFQAETGASLQRRRTLHRRGLHVNCEAYPAAWKKGNEYYRQLTGCDYYYTMEIPYTEIQTYLSLDETDESTESESPDIAQPSLLQLIAGYIATNAPLHYDNSRDYDQLIRLTPIHQ